MALCIQVIVNREHRAVAANIASPRRSRPQNVKEQSLVQGGELTSV
jgi:hypothetical protein